MKNVENCPNEKMKKTFVITKLEHMCKHDQIQKIVIEITNISCKWQLVTNSHKLIGYKKT
jgi:hypothetical protein